MRTKKTDLQIIGKILYSRAGLPENYAIQPIRNLDDVIGADSTIKKTLPKVLRMESGLNPERFYEGEDSTGFVIKNEDYKHNDGIVAAILLDYDERFDRSNMKSGRSIRKKRRVIDENMSPEEILEQEQMYKGEEELDLETTTIIGAGVLPADPKSKTLSDVLLNLAIYKAGDTGSYDIAFPTWDQSPLVASAITNGFEYTKHEIKTSKGDKKIKVLQKKQLTLKDQIRSVANLVGNEWVMNSYLGELNDLEKDKAETDNTINFKKDKDLGAYKRMVEKAIESKVSSNVEIVPMSEHHYKEILSFNKKEFPVWKKSDDNELTEVMDDDDFLGFVVKTKKEGVIAYIAGCKPNQEDFSEHYKLKDTFYSAHGCVDSRFRQEGVYTALKSLFHASLKSLGYKSVVLHSKHETGLMKIHKSMGYKRELTVDEFYYEEEPAIVMRKPLSKAAINNERKNIDKMVKNYAK